MATNETEPIKSSSLTLAIYFAINQICFLFVVVFSISEFHGDYEIGNISGEAQSNHPLVTSFSM